MNVPVNAEFVALSLQETFQEWLPTATKRSTEAVVEFGELTLLSVTEESIVKLHNNPRARLSVAFQLSVNVEIVLLLPFEGARSVTLGAVVSTPTDVTARMLFPALPPKSMTKIVRL